jgi:hypothetical protein
MIHTCATCGQGKGLVQGQKPNKYFVCVGCQAEMAAAGKCKHGHDLAQHADPKGRCRACKRMQDRGYARQALAHAVSVYPLHWPAPRVEP